jgi:phosphoglycolate phosphatase-like HAD superfamily hydrolase
MPVPVIRGLRELAPQYDALILDLWGVVHGGVEPYPGVLETLAELRGAGKRLGLLSNAPRRAATVATKVTASPPLPQPKHLKRPFDGLTLKLGVFSLWKGQQAL